VLETKKEEEPTQVEKIKMHSDISNGHLLKIEKCSLNELFAILQRHATSAGFLTMPVVDKCNDIHREMHLHK
jgi:hypothetical protein